MMMVLLTECKVSNPHLSHRRNCSQRVQIWEALWRVCQTVDPGVAIIAIIITITRPRAALRTAGLDWIVGPGYSSGRYILEKNHEEPTWNHENHENQPGTMKNQPVTMKNHKN